MLNIPERFRGDDFTDLFFNANEAVSQEQEIDQAEKLASDDLEQEAEKWHNTNYQLS